MDVIKITLLKYISQAQIDFISNNDIKIKLSYNGYTIETECIKNTNNPLIDKDFIFHYVKDIPLIINVYDTHNILGDVLLQQIVKKDFSMRVKSRMSMPTFAFTQQATPSAIISATNCKRS